MPSVTNTYQPSMAKMLAIFIAAIIGLLVVNDLVFFNLFKGSFVKGKLKFKKVQRLNSKTSFEREN